MISSKSLNYPNFPLQFLMTSHSNTWNLWAKKWSLSFSSKFFLFGSKPTTETAYFSGSKMVWSELYSSSVLDEQLDICQRNIRTNTVVIISAVICPRAEKLVLEVLLPMVNIARFLEKDAGKLSKPVPLQLSYMSQPAKGSRNRNSRAILLINSKQKKTPILKCLNSSFSPQTLRNSYSMVPSCCLTLWEQLCLRKQSCALWYFASEYSWIISDSIMLTLKMASCTSRMCSSEMFLDGDVEKFVGFVWLPIVELLEFGRGYSFLTRCSRFRSELTGTPCCELYGVVLMGACWPGFCRTSGTKYSCWFVPTIFNGSSSRETATGTCWQVCDDGNWGYDSPCDSALLFS